MIQTRDYFTVNDYYFCENVLGSFSELYHFQSKKIHFELKPYFIPHYFGYDCTYFLFLLLLFFDNNSNRGVYNSIFFLISLPKYNNLKYIIPKMAPQAKFV